MSGLDGSLAQLPSEIVLRILDYLPPSSVARLTRASKNWHRFIDDAHQDQIYFSKTDRPSKKRDLNFLGGTQSFIRYYDGIKCWKELCKKQTLLKRNWASDQPWTQEAIVHVFPQSQAIWRFRPDFQNRLFLFTTMHGGIFVKDMDTGSILWSLAAVRPFAHLEYDAGWAAWDRTGNAIEIWRLVRDSRTSTELRQIAILQHDCETRGFHLIYPTLCVVSVEGRAFVYDISHDPPKMQTKFGIEAGAVGHLCQDKTAVVFSLGLKGYHIHCKTSGALLGVLEPQYFATNIYHIRHPQSSNMSRMNKVYDSKTSPFPLSSSSQDRLVRLELGYGPHSRHTSDYLSPQDDEWGAGLISDKLMVGISKSGRLLICSNWPEAMRSRERAAAVSTIIECETDAENFHLGGWLSLNQGRVMFEVGDMIYLLSIPEDGIPFVHQTEPLLAMLASGTMPSVQLSEPISWMGVFDDCVMATSLILARDPRHVVQYPLDGTYEEKAIRVLSFAPST
ncbi:MAG: hypothetical protein M1820_007715 [Bogoriella megaspora]|nr:MAG: hypothetical protein M1820_007715 [Bogoriella megaspora]